MKIKKIKLQNIIQEEIKSLIQEEELDEGWIEDLMTWFKTPSPEASKGVASDLIKLSNNPKQTDSGTIEVSPEDIESSEDVKSVEKPKILSPVEDEPEIFDQYSVEKMKTGTEEFKKTFSELSRLLKTELEKHGIEKNVVKQFLGALSVSLNKNLTSLTLKEEKEQLMISNLIHKYFSGGPQEPNKLSPVRIRDILKIIKNWAQQNSSFVEDEVNANPGIELPKDDKPSAQSVQQNFGAEDIVGMYENKYSNFYNKWKKHLKG